MPHDIYMRYAMPCRAAARYSASDDAARDKARGMSAMPRRAICELLMRDDAADII